MKNHALHFIIVAGTILVATTVFAQDFAMDSFAVDPGGGTSISRVFEISSRTSPAQPMATTRRVSASEGVFACPVNVVPPLPTEPITIFDNTTGSDNGGSGVTATAWLASRFCPESQSYQLTSLSLLLNSQDFSGAAGPPSTVQLQIYAHDTATGKPSTNTGMLMNLSSHTNPVALVRGQQLVRWTNATQFTLAADTCYWAVLSRESGGRIGQIASFTKPSGDAGGFGATSSANAGATWETPTQASNNKMLIQGVAVKSDHPPLLSIVRQGPTVRIFWPISASDFVLDQTTTATTDTWWQVPFPYETNAIDISVREPSHTGNKFYRLRRP